MVPIADRSPEPANRCALPQSASADAAGWWRLRIASRTSAAAASRAPGRTGLGSAAEYAYGEDEPHRGKRHRADGHGVEARWNVISTGVDVGVSNPRGDKNPGEHHEHDVVRTRDKDE